MPTQQHFLPVFYLKGFADPNTPTGQKPYTWVFPFAESRWRKRSPNNVAAESGFYNFTDDHGKTNQAFEQFLSQVPIPRGLHPCLLRSPHLIPARTSTADRTD
jgi:hypothetical protein